MKFAQLMSRELKLRLQSVPNLRHVEIRRRHGPLFRAGEAGKAFFEVQDLRLRAHSIQKRKAPSVIPLRAPLRRSFENPAFRIEDTGP